MDYPNDKGVSARQGFLQVLKSAEDAGDQDKIDDIKNKVMQPEIPGELYGLVDTFWACRDERGISIQGLFAYCQLTGEKLTYAEIKLIRAMDSAATKWISNKIKNDNKPKIENKPPQGGTARRR